VESSRAVEILHQTLSAIGKELFAGLGAACIHHDIDLIVLNGEQARGYDVISVPSGICTLPRFFVAPDVGSLVPVKSVLMETSDPNVTK
jgi:hypothetical protein